MLGFWWESQTQNFSLAHHKKSLKTRSPRCCWSRRRKKSLNCPFVTFKTLIALKLFSNRFQWTSLNHHHWKSPWKIALVVSIANTFSSPLFFRCWAFEVLVKSTRNAIECYLIIYEKKASLSSLPLLTLKTRLTRSGTSSPTLTRTRSKFVWRFRKLSFAIMEEEKIICSDLNAIRGSLKRWWIIPSWKCSFLIEILSRDIIRNRERENVDDIKFIRDANQAASSAKLLTRLRSQSTLLELFN